MGSENQVATKERTVWISEVAVENNNKKKTHLPDSRAWSPQKIANKAVSLKEQNQALLKEFYLNLR